MLTPTKAKHNRPSDQTTRGPGAYIVPRPLKNVQTELRHMEYKIERIPFPYDTIPAVAAVNRDGTYTIYENALCSEARCEKAVRLLVDKITKE